MKVAFLIANLYGGGTERVIISLAKKFTELGNNVSIITLEKGKDYEINEKIELLILSNYEDKKNGVLKKVFYFTIQLINFVKFMRNNNIKIVLSFLERSNLVNVLSRLFIRHTAICNTRINLSEGYSKDNGLLKNIIFSKIIKITGKLSCLIICNSEGIKSDLIKNFKLHPGKIKVINNPCDLKTIAEMRSKKIDSKLNDIFLKGPVIINIGRLEKQKSQWFLVRAFHLIKAKVSNIKLIILGTGPEKDNLVNIIRKMNLEDHVYMLGFQKNPYSFLARSKVFVLSSLWEGFPNVILEAMACGLPVVSFDCKSGPREILSPGTDINQRLENIEYARYGILVPVPDGKFYGKNIPLLTQEKLLATAIIKLLEDKELYERYSKMSLERVKDFELDKIANEYFELIKKYYD